MTPSSKTQTLPLNAEQRILQELAAGERVLWSGRPAFFRMAQRFGANTTLGVLCLFFSVLGTIKLATGGSVPISEGTVISGWSGVVLIIFFFFPISVWLIQGQLQPFWQKYNTAYFVTEQRVLLLPPSGPAKSLTPGQIRDRQMIAARWGKSGDLFFSVLEEMVPLEYGDDKVGNGFLGIPSVSAVDALLRATFG